ncbi:MAG TPA: GyrI-like domain-containing protein [Thermotogota bacterium]|nr:GyrI-like domain-containing protein [Thermotogota bacterium]HRW93418.1 GyrI-like domain-containing protein [Thermotogota bacterium]
MDKRDLKKEYKQLYGGKAGEMQLLTVPRLPFLMVDGQGDPNLSEWFGQATELLYGLSYTIKFALKKSRELDYVVMPLEGLWWAQHMDAFSLHEKGNWLWTLMILQPDEVTLADVEDARDVLKKKKKLSDEIAGRVRFEELEEGLCAQVMYLGAYEQEAPTIAKLHAFIQEKGYTLSGKHHEIYLGDPRKTAPEKLKTIIRQPVSR